MKTILFVDDEIQILKAIRRVLAETEYQLYLAATAEEGLKIMEEGAVDMIVSDMRMPGMDGIELLKIVRFRFPDVTRLILSGYADENEIHYTLQSDLAKAYIFKPWNNDELLKAIWENMAI